VSEAAERISPSFVKTKLYEKCKSRLAEKGLVIIIGDMGTGKSTYAKALFEEQKTKMKNRDCFEVRSPIEIEFMRSLRATIYFDNIFGQHVEDIKMTMEWRLQMPKVVEMRRRVSLILTSRSDIYHKCKHRKGIGRLDEFVVEVSCQELDSNEIENIAQAMGLTSPLVHQPSDLSLLQQCEIRGVLFPWLQKKKAVVVTTELLDEYFEDLKKKNPSQYASLLLALVNNNGLSEKDLEKQTTIETLRIIGQRIEKKSFKNIKEALRTLSFSVLMQQDHRYSFANNSLFHIASKYFMRQHPDIIVSSSSIECLEILSPLFDTVNEVHSQALSEKLAGQIEHLIQQKLFCLLKNERTLREFLTIISGDKKLDLFLESDFFWYICWCDSFLIMEMLLRKMSGRKEVVKKALDYCSDHFKSALQRYIEKDHPEEILSPTNMIRKFYFKYNIYIYCTDSIVKWVSCI
jgi:shikimate kinase